MSGLRSETLIAPALGVRHSPVQPFLPDPTEQQDRPGSPTQKTSIFRPCLKTMLRTKLRKLQGMNEIEELAIDRLAEARRKISMNGDRVNTSNEAGHAACVSFLDHFVCAARALRVNLASRRYRNSFSLKYSRLFDGEAPSYRVCILEACFEQEVVVWANGQKLKFSAEALRHSARLTWAWANISELLEAWSLSAILRPSRAQLQKGLAAFDLAWASFERSHIAELMVIEAQARQPLVQAIEYERELRCAEKAYTCDEKNVSTVPYEFYSSSEELKRLLVSMAKLNAVANLRRKGRDVLSIDVLLDAFFISSKSDSSDTASVSRILAADVISSFNSMRHYLHHVEGFMDIVDPHLRHNAGLVSRLVNLEESLDVRAQYLRDRVLLRATDAAIREVNAAQRVLPAFKAMCEDCDAEVFMVLPRIIWLNFLMKPEETCHLVKSMLAHHFSTEYIHDSACTTVRVICRTPELIAFIDMFTKVKEQFADAHPDADEADFLKILMERAVLGTAVGSLRFEAVEGLMRVLEGYSLELQRHSPEDWNQCSAILLRCVSGTKGCGQANFRV